jgi:hypothetical protein
MSPKLPCASKAAASLASIQLVKEFHRLVKICFRDYCECHKLPQLLRNRRR